MAVFSLRTAISALLPLLALLPTTQAASNAPTLITYTNNQNEPVYLEDNRRPSLYTGHFGDCLGNGRSQLNVTRFDAALYMDNMTVTFHIEGTTALKREAVMLYLGVYAYGESRFEIAFNPCGTNIYSLCPANSSVPVEASGVIPLGQQDVQSIPSIALSIPDFEGQAILRLFSNSTQTEIGCYTASVTNGGSFDQQDSVSVVLVLFTLVAIAASLASAVYGDNVPQIRPHYAHSLSVLVVFAVFQHIYFTGALSMNWPSVLVSWQANFAWAGGMIYTSGMQNSISKLMGHDFGNTLALGAARAGADSSNVGGGYDVHKIYKRSAANHIFGGSLSNPHFEKKLAKRTLANATTGFKWYGNAVRPGLPLPGNYSGFAGTLSKENIPASNAFLTGLIWFAVLLLLVAGSVTAVKFILEGMYRFKWMKTERLNHFRSHWLGYLASALLRSCYIAFFTMIFLAVFQFTYDGAPAAIAIAAIVFVIFLVGMFGIAAYACHYRLRAGTWTSEPDRVFLESRKVWKFIPWYRFHKSSAVHDSEKVFSGSLPWWKISHHPEDGQIPVHQDEAYINKFGWLASRFRLSKWWFFLLWLSYEFIRACFYAGASGYPLVQVFGLLIVEFLAFLIIIKIRPYEGQRLNVIMVYLLGFSKVATVALSAAFDINFNIQRIAATAIGIVIIVIQGFLTIALLICIALSAISTYFSLTRNREAIRPRRWMPYRERYYAHVETAASDIPPAPKPPAPVPELPKEPQGPYFSVNSVRRVAKIEDEDEEFQKEIATDPRNSSRLSINKLSIPEFQPAAGAQTSGATASNRISRAASISSNLSHTSLPYGARLHRGSWSTRDVSDIQAERESSTDRRSRHYVSAFDGNDTVASPYPEASSSSGNTPPSPTPQTPETPITQTPIEDQSHAVAASPVTDKPTSGLDDGRPGSSSSMRNGAAARPQTPVRSEMLANVGNRSPVIGSAPSSPSRAARFSRERGSLLSHKARDDIVEGVEVDEKGSS